MWIKKKQIGDFTNNKGVQAIEGEIESAKDQSLTNNEVWTFYDLLNELCVICPTWIIPAIVFT